MASALVWHTGAILGAVVALLVEESTYFTLAKLFEDSLGTGRTECLCRGNWWRELISQGTRKEQAEGASLNHWSPYRHPRFVQRSS
jgi:hypothetical protein